MSEKDKALVEENMKLVFFVINRYYPTFVHDEDLKQVGAIGLCKAAKTWDAEKSTFSTYASRVILNEIKMEFRRRRKFPPTTSLNYEIDNGEGGHEEVMNLIVGEADVDYFDFKAFYDRLSPMDREILDARRDGVTEAKIAERFGVTQSCICRHIKNMEYSWRKFYGD